MSRTIDTAYINQFKADLHHLVEQKASKLRPTVKLEIASGEKHFFDRLGVFTANEVTSATAPVSLQDAAHSRRMATIRVYDANTYLSDFDKVKMLIDPTSDYAMKLARAHAKNLDDIIISAALNAASTGKDGSGSASFDTSNNQIAHGSAGLTVAKFNQALRILELNEVDIDGQRIYCALGARAKEDLLGDSSNQLTSFDFQDSKVLSNGGLPNFRGVNMVTTQRITDETSGTTFRALMYTEDTIKVAMAKDLNINVAQRHDLNLQPIQVATSMAMGAVRMEEETIVDILYQ